MNHALRLRGYLILLATIVAPVIGYIAYRQEHCRSLRSTAFEAFSRQEWSYAAHQFEKYLQCDPEDQQALHLCVQSYYEAKNGLQTHSWIDRTKLTFPDDPVPDYWRGVLLIEEQQNFAKALPLLESVRFMVEHQYPKVNLYIGIALTKSGDILAGCANLQYYLNSPQEDDNDIHRVATDTYRSICTDITP